MKKLSLRILALVLVCTFVLVGCSGSGTYPDPNKNLTIIVERGAGGGTDLTARAIAPVLEEHLGIPVVVENKAGADGVIGLNELINSELDGYTIGVSTNTVQSIHAVMYPDAEYTEDSWDYLATTNVTSYIMIVGSDSDFTTLEEVIEYAKENPGELTLGTPSGVAEVMATVEMNTGAEFTQIVNTSGAENLAALAGGHVDVGFLTASFYQQCVDQGLNVVGILSDERFETAPDLPTFVEQGYDAVLLQHWIILAPKGLPEDVKATLQEAISAMGADPAFTQNLADIDMIPDFNDSAELQQETLDYLTGITQNIADWQAMKGA